MSQNVWPEPHDKEDRVKAEADFVHRFFQGLDIPGGSEGPIECKTIITDRGPTVILTGDLRDFGEKDLDSIVEWINNIAKRFQEEIISKKIFLPIRDAFIYCDVEFDESNYLIIKEDGADPLTASKFQLKKYSR